MIYGSVELQSEIWQNGEIIADVWFDESSAFDPEAFAYEVSNYYLKQMNFLGNPF